MTTQAQPRSGGFPALLPVPEVQARLERLFPPAMPERALLVGRMCARAVYVFLYGGFVGPASGLLRPAHVYFFTEEQSHRTDDEERADWVARSSRQSYRPPGRRWYADTTRESLRDDLFRNRLRVLGVMHRQAGVPTTSSRPAYYVAEDFAALFAPGRPEPELEGAMQAWRERHLDAAVQSRMKLRHAFVAADAADLPIDMPDGTRIKVAAGPSSLILKGIVERFAPRYLGQPAVLWLSASDRKVWPQFEATARAVGLTISASADLPDLILADLAPDTPPRFVVCEIVATDGAITEARKASLLALLERSTLPRERVEFLTAFADRESAALRKNFGRLAVESLAWFQSEPDVLVHLRRLPQE